MLHLCEWRQNRDPCGQMGRDGMSHSVLHAERDIVPADSQIGSGCCHEYLGAGQEAVGRPANVEQMVANGATRFLLSSVHLRNGTYSTASPNAR